MPTDDNDICADRITALAAVIMILIKALEKSNSIQRVDWATQVRGLIEEFQKHNDIASEHAVAQLKVILDVCAPRKRFVDKPKIDPARMILRVISGGKPSDPNTPEQS